MTKPLTPVAPPTHPHADPHDDTAIPEQADTLVEVTLTINGDWRADPLRLLGGLRRGSAHLEGWETKAVAAAREQGLSWEAIGAACGISRQAAWERFAKAPVTQVDAPEAMP